VIESIESIESIHGSVSFLSVCPWALPGWAAVASRLNPQHPWSGPMGNQVRFQCHFQNTIMTVSRKDDESVRQL